MADTTDSNGTTPRGRGRPRKTAATGTTTAKATPAPKTAGPKPRAARAAAATPAGAALAKDRFAKALEDAKAGAAALKDEATKRGAAYRAKVAEGGNDWVGEAKTIGDTALKRGATLAQEGKTKASDALASLGKAVSDNAATIDSKLGAQYGDYARTAARTMQETAARLDAKSFDELANDGREFVRKSPAAAIGIATVAGFMLARMFKGGSKD